MALRKTSTASWTGTPRVGDVISDKYRLERSLASGGMGILMLASQIGLGRKVVVKFLREEAAASGEITARFLREARTAATLRGEHVVRVVDVGALPSGSPYFVMEHLDGCDLSDELDAVGPLAPADAVRWILQASEALAEAHARGVVHRDLKPSNLFLAKAPDGSRRLKVLDFGISKTAPEPGDRPLTATRAVLGTPDYMSPEQIRDFRNVDARSDIWSLGVVLYELLSRERPFEAPNAAGLCVAIATEAPIPLGKRRPDVPKALESIVHKCLKKDPAERFSSISEFARALLPFASATARESAARIDAIAGIERVTGPPAAPSPAAFDEAQTAPVEWRSNDSQRKLDARPNRSGARRRVVVVLGSLGVASVVAYFGWRDTRSGARPETEPATASAPSPSAPFANAPPASAFAVVAPGVTASTLVSPEPQPSSAGVGEGARPAASAGHGSRRRGSVRAPGRAPDVLGEKAFSDRK